MDWPSAIGLFLLNFGTLDYLVTLFLKDHLVVGEFAKVRERPFKDRVEMIGRYLEDTHCPTEAQESVAKLCDRIGPIRVLRNHIAHGHILSRWDIDAAAWAISVSLPKDLDLTYSAETRHLDWTELRTQLKELTELIEAFKRLTGFSTEET